MYLSGLNRYKLFLDLRWPLSELNFLARIKHELSQDFRILTQVEHILNLSGPIRVKPDHPLSQLHPHLLSGAPSVITPLWWTVSDSDRIQTDI